MKNLLLFLFIIMVFTSCNKKYKENGKIDVQLLIYNNPSVDPYDAFLMPISTMYFKEKTFIETLQHYKDGIPLPDQSFALIKDSLYSVFSDLNSVTEVKPNKSVKSKDIGVKFNTDIIDYNRRENLNDTILNGLKYKRARIVSDSVYTVFYIQQTDTILPFSLSPQFDKDYHGVLNRVDTYEKKHDRFTSLRMTVSDTIPRRFYNALNQVK